jgi:transcription elongation factor Elf1
LAQSSKTIARAMGQKQDMNPQQRLETARTCIRCSKKIETLGDLFPVKIAGKGMSAYCKACRDSLYK